MDFRGLAAFARMARSRAASAWRPKSQRALDARLDEAVAQNDIERVRQALREGADPNARGVDCPLHRAAKWAGPEVALALLEAGARVDELSGLGRRPLHDALENPLASPKLIRLLLARGACPNARTLDDLAPLRVAIHFASVEALEILLAFGADPNAPLNEQDLQGSTALASCARADDLERVKALVKAGARVEREIENARGGADNHAWGWLRSRAERRQLEREACAGRKKCKARAL